MLNRLKILTVSSLLITGISYSQNTNAFQANDLLNTNDVIRSVGNRTNTNAVDQATGSAYILDSYLPVKIKGYEGQVYSGRYNAYNGKMEINLGDKVIALNNTITYEVVFTQDNKMYRTFNYTTLEGKTKSKPLVVIKETEDYALLKEEIIRYYEKVPAVSSYDKDKPAKFVRQPDRYYIKNDEKITPIPTGKKGLYKVFPEHTKALKSYAKKNKLSHKNEKDFAEMIDYVMALQSK